MRLALKRNAPLFYGNGEEGHANEFRVSCRKKFEFHGKAFKCHMHVNPTYLVFRCGHLS